MKTFNVFYAVVTDSGVLEERCLVVDNCKVKHDAISIYHTIAPKNAMFRCVKTHLLLRAKNLLL